MKKIPDVKAMTRQEIAELYKVSWKTLKKRLDKNGIILPRGLVYPNDINKIYEHLGLPQRAT